MSFGEMLASSWKVYRLHWQTIVAIVFLCSFVPFVMLSFSTPVLAFLFHLGDTYMQYTIASDQSSALTRALFTHVPAFSNETLGALNAQKAVVADLQRQLFPVFGVQFLLEIGFGLVGLWGVFALLLGFFGKFGSASALLREARKQYGRLFLTFLAFLVVLLGGGFIAFLALLLLLVLCGAIVSVIPVLGVFIGILGGLGLLVCGVYCLLGITFTLYEAIAHRVYGFSAIRGAWARVKGKRWMLIGNHLLWCLVLFLCLLPFGIVALVLYLQGMDGALLWIMVFLQMVYLFVIAPLMYFFYGFLYKRL